MGECVLFIYLFHSFTTTKEIGKQNHTAEELAELRISVVEGLLHTDMYRECVENCNELFSRKSVADLEGRLGATTPFYLEFNKIVLAVSINCTNNELYIAKSVGNAVIQ